ncbi:MAG: aspartyl/asparaginyl beta-hydroxylase domain-containing protein [Acidobacteria bacterium]|nr:aspartyl/asparaginyl beta-hydroxylase domain-containing protein [Acidobacteriota bacterium]
MRELYGINGLRYVVRVILCQALALAAAFTFCLLLALSLWDYVTWPRWAGSLLLLFFYAAAAAWVGLLWEALAGNLFRLDLVAVPSVHRRILFPLLGVCAVAAALVSHVTLTRSVEGVAGAAQTWGLAAALLVFAAALCVSLWLLRVVLRATRKKRRRAEGLTRLLDSAQAEAGADGLRRIEEFVQLESGRMKATPPVLIRGAVFPGLSSRPWYDASEFEWAKEIEAAYEVVREEVLAATRKQQGFERYSYPGLGDNDWESLMFYRGGKEVEENCARCPETAALLRVIPGSQRREAMVSVLGPGARIPPHRDSGNQLLTCHFGLVVPPDCGIRVGGEVRTWQEGRCLIFDTSYEHEAWNHSDRTRIILLVDFWHPELTEVERRFLDKIEGLGYW